MSPSSAVNPEVASIDFSRLIKGKGEKDAFREAQLRTDARLARFSKMTADEKFVAFDRINYHPHGLYVPDAAETQEILKNEVRALEVIEDRERRTIEYLKLQAQTWEWMRQGMLGRWTGQMAVALSQAKFRLVAWGRRGGKTFHAAREALALAIMRPGAWIWVCAPTLKLVGRCFDMILKLVEELKIGYTTKHNSPQEKLLVLANGSRFEGVSLEEGAESAGASVDLAIIDEADKVENKLVWEETLLPVLADRDGDALMISSFYAGDGTLFQEMADKHSKEGDPDWDVFKGASWENFFEFPQGRNTKKILVLQRNMDPVKFLEQFGAIPARNKDVVFFEFKARVHMNKDVTFDPKTEVRLAIDPSSGGDPYAVRVYQDYGDYYNQIDEFYESGITVEELSPLLDRRIWRDNVAHVVVDSNWPDEIDRWVKRGWPAYPVPEKPEIRERVPIHRRWLRDPGRFYNLYLQKVNKILAEMGIRDNYYDLPLEQQQMIAIQVEEALGDQNLTDDDILALRRCSRVHIAYHCVNTGREYRLYKYKKGTEKFAVGNDHLMDCGGYYDWTFHRTDDEVDIERDFNYVHADPAYAESLREAATHEAARGHHPMAAGAEGLVVPREPGRGFLAHLRERHSPENRGGVSYLRSH